MDEDRHPSQDVLHGLIVYINVVRRHMQTHPKF